MASRAAATHGGGGRARGLARGGGCACKNENRGGGHTAYSGVVLRVALGARTTAVRTTWTKKTMERRRLERDRRGLQWGWRKKGFALYRAGHLYSRDEPLPETKASLTPVQPRIGTKGPSSWPEPGLKTL